MKIIPIYAFGHQVLRDKNREIKEGEEGIAELIADMYTTMYNASGVGLAAPQIGKNLRLFITDGTPMDGTLEDDPTPMKGWKKVFINPVIIEETGDEWDFEEGCLSIPDVRSDVKRPEVVRLRYLDENFEEHEEEFGGLQARIIQHEYDHLEGVLFTDYVKGLRKKMLKSRLTRISKGLIEPAYPMEFSKKKQPF